MLKTLHKFGCAFLLAALGMSQAWSLEVVRTPYLQMGDTDSVTIRWQTDESSDGWVQYGTTLEEQTESSETAASSTDQSITITGLLPGTRYYYSIHTSEGALIESNDEYYFETAPETGSQSPVRFAVLGESGTSSWNPKVNVRNALIEWCLKQDHRLNLFLHLGNMSNNEGTEEGFQANFFDVYSGIMRNTVTFPTMGEYEALSSNANEETGPYFENFTLPTQGESGGVSSGTKAYYSFDYANAHFIALESNQLSREPGSPMLTWLEEDLAATQQEWIIAYWHHTPYSMGSYNTDVEVNHTEMREKVLPILEAGGVDLVFGGSSHIYERSFLVDGAYDTPTTSPGHILAEGDGSIATTPYVKSSDTKSHQGTVYVTAGHGGLELSKEGDHPLMYFVEEELGSCVVDITGGLLTLSNIRHDGVVSDTFTIMKKDGLLLASPIGGESFERDTEELIRWTSVGEIPEVDISYSLNGGDLWIPIAQKAPNTGSHPWNIPTVNTKSALVRVEASGDSTFSDTSTEGFSITTNLSKELFPFGSEWRYHDKNEDPGVDWNTVEFDDSSWDTGSGSFGFDVESNTTVFSTEDPKVPTLYFRKTISFDELPDTVRLTSQLNGGYAVFVNGIEISRKQIEDLAFEEWATLTEFEDIEISKKMGIGIDLGTRNCAELQASGITENGVYDVWPEGPDGVELSVYCEMNADGGGWTRVFYHDVSDGYFDSNDDAHSKNADSPLALRYSILNQLNLFRSSDETYKLRINWPNDLQGRNIWRQTSHPTVAPIQGYEALDIEFTTQHWGGLELSTSGSTYVDGSVQHGNWFYSIGSQAVWSGGIPAHGPSAQRVALWVKPDTLAPFEVGAPFEGEGNVLAIMVKQGEGELNHAAFDAELVSYTNIKSPNNVPDFPDQGVLQYYVGKEISIQLIASDPDGDELVYITPYLPEGAQLDFQTGIFTWTPNKEQVGDRGLKITVADLRGASTWQTVFFNVGLNAPPEDAGSPADLDAVSTTDAPITSDLGTGADEDVLDSDLVETSPSSGGCTAHSTSSKTPYGALVLCALLGLFVGRKRRPLVFNG